MSDIAEALAPEGVIVENSAPRRGPGRPRRNFPQTRGRPADKKVAARTDSAEFLDDDGNPLTRRKNVDGVVNDFELPNEYKIRGWDYEWKTMTINGQPVDPSDLTRVYEGGWRPVKATEMPRLCPPGWSEETIRRYGQMLFKRPMKFTLEAKAEDLKRAEQQKIDKLKGALAGPDEHAKISKRTIQALEIEGEVGVYADK